MELVLTKEQSQAIHAQPEEPVRLIDPHGEQSYVLLRADLYAQLLAASQDEYQLSDTCAAQIQSAMRAGWDDEAMDKYNNYDENYKKLCQ